MQKLAIRQPLLQKLLPATTAHRCVRSRSGVAYWGDSEPGRVSVFRPQGKTYNEACNYTGVRTVVPQSGGGDFIVALADGTFALIQDQLEENAISRALAAYFQINLENAKVLAVSSAFCDKRRAAACVSVSRTKDGHTQYAVYIIHGSDSLVTHQQAIPICGDAVLDDDMTVSRFACHFNSLGTQLAIGCVFKGHRELTEYQILDDSQDVEFDPTFPQQYVFDTRAREEDKGKVWIRTSHYVYKEALPCMGYSVGDRYIMGYRNCTNTVAEAVSASLANAPWGRSVPPPQGDARQDLDSLETLEDGAWNPASYMQDPEHLEHYKRLYDVAGDMQYTKDTFDGFSSHAVYLFEPWQLAYPHEVIPLTVDPDGQTNSEAEKTTDIVSLADNLICKVWMEGKCTHLQFYMSSSYVWKLLKELTFPFFRAYRGAARLDKAGCLSLLLFADSVVPGGGDQSACRDDYSALASGRSGIYALTIPFEVVLPLSNQAPVLSRLQDRILCCHMLASSVIPPPAYDVGRPFSGSELPLDCATICRDTGDGPPAELATEVVVLTMDRVLTFLIKPAECQTHDDSADADGRECPEIAGDTSYQLHAEIIAAEEMLERQEIERKYARAALASKDLEDLGDDWGPLGDQGEAGGQPGRGAITGNGGPESMTGDWVVDPFRSNYVPAYVPRYRVEEAQSGRLATYFASQGLDPALYTPIQLDMAVVDPDEKESAAGKPHSGHKYALVMAAMNLVTGAIVSVPLCSTVSPFVSRTCVDQFSIGNRFEIPSYELTVSSRTLAITSLDPSVTPKVTDSVTIEPHAKILYANAACTRIVLTMPRGNLETRFPAPTNFVHMMAEFGKIWAEKEPLSGKVEKAQAFFEEYSQKRLTLDELIEAFYRQREDPDFASYVKDFAQLLLQLKPSTLLRLLEAVPSIPAGMSSEEVRTQFLCAFWIKLLSTMVRMVCSPDVLDSVPLGDFTKSLLTAAATAASWISAAHFGSTNALAVQWMRQECFLLVLVCILGSTHSEALYHAFSAALTAFNLPFLFLVPGLAHSLGEERVCAMAPYFDVTSESARQRLQEEKIQATNGLSRFPLLPGNSPTLLNWDLLSKASPKTMPTLNLLRTPEFSDVPLDLSPFRLLFKSDMAKLSLAEAKSLVSFSDLKACVLASSGGEARCCDIAQALAALEAGPDHRRLAQALIVFTCWYYTHFPRACAQVFRLLAKNPHFGKFDKGCGTGASSDRAEFSALIFFITGDERVVEHVTDAGAFRFLVDVRRMLGSRQKGEQAGHDTSVDTHSDHVESNAVVGEDAEPQTGRKQDNPFSHEYLTSQVARYLLHRQLCVPQASLRDFYLLAEQLVGALARQEGEMLEKLTGMRTRLQASEDALRARHLRVEQARALQGRPMSVGKKEAELVSQVQETRSAVEALEKRHLEFRRAYFDLVILLSSRFELSEIEGLGT